jgi:hypothetical protein
MSNLPGSPLTNDPDPHPSARDLEQHILISMDWLGTPNSRTLAGLYLVAFLATLIGLVLTLINQWTEGEGSRVAVGATLFVGGALGITALAFGLRNRVPAPTSRFAANTTNYQRAWQRLALGRELPAAWRALMR